MMRTDHLVGTWRRFGALGPTYQIVGPGAALADGERLMRIRLIETGEEADYKLTAILDDPEEE